MIDVGKVLNGTGTWSQGEHKTTVYRSSMKTNCGAAGPWLMALKDQ